MAVFFTFNLATLSRNGNVGMEVNVDLILFTGTEVIYSKIRCWFMCKGVNKAI